MCDFYKHVCKSKFLWLNTNITFVKVCNMLIHLKADELNEKKYKQLQLPTIVLLRTHIQFLFVSYLSI